MRLTESWQSSLEYGTHSRSGSYLKADNEPEISTIHAINTGMCSLSQAAFEASDLRRGSSEYAVDAMDIISSIVYEPERISTSTAPPKRFFRTFWRSIVRRILQRDLKASKMI